MPQEGGSYSFIEAAPRMVSRRRFDFTDSVQLVQWLGLTEQVGESSVIQTGTAYAIGQLIHVNMETVRFQRLDLNMPWIRSLRASDGWLTVLIPICSGPRPIFHGRKIQPAQVAVFGPGAELFEIVEESTEGRFFEISIHAGRVHLEYLRAFGSTAPDLNGLCEVLDLADDPDDWIQSIETLGELLSAASLKGLPLEVDLDTALVRIVLQCLRVVADLRFRKGVTLAGCCGSKHEDALLRCRKFIHDHIHQTLSIDELSRASGYSERQLQHLFKLRLGMAPLEYVRHYRFQKAREALKLWAGSVKEAALSCGFTELGRFSVKYRTVFGESPNETLHSRTAPRESGYVNPALMNQTPDESLTLKTESKMRLKNTSADALVAGWRSGIPFQQTKNR